jgi:hypothetical protein
MLERSPTAFGGAHVTKIVNFSDPTAQSVIDKCASHMQSTAEGEIEVTILWSDQGCPGSVYDEDSPNYHS